MENTPQRYLEKIREAKEKQLKELDLSNDWHTDNKEKLTEIPAEVFQLEWLEVLNLSGNQLRTLPEAIARLQQLTSLDLSGNQLRTLPEAIARLQQLTSLDLKGNQLRTLPEVIARLQQLTSLDLSVNELRTLPEAIARLQQLTSLNLRGNQLTTLPEVIARLQQLTSLDLNGNRLRTLPEAITRLQQLTSLNLSVNELRTLPEALTRLQQLTSLYLIHNRLRTLPEAIARLQQLTSLNLSFNQLTTLPEAIASLQQLTTLDLSYNQLTTLPEAIVSHQQLTTLNLSYNKLTTLPEAIASLQQLTTLNLWDNPIEKPPPEVVEKGIKAIKDYLRQIQVEGTDYLYEAKLLIVGEGGAGKTTLAKKIKDQNYQLREEDSTKGIEVILWGFPMENGREFQVNIWDFGGQEIYHATHQFFLTKRSLYTLVADTRKEDTDFYYWLNVVELLSDNSPLLIIKNEKQNRYREINELQLRGQFTNLKETLATNLATNRDLEQVLDKIKHYIKNLPHIGSPLPKTWVKVREALESDARNYISLDDYLKICQQNGFTQRNDKLQLSGYLHDLGVCLHFQEDALLNKTVILKPKWGTDAVYKVLDNEKVIRNLGSFTRSDLANIWYEDEYTTMHDELLRLMINFNLCYEIPRSQGKYIAPQLLSANQLSYNWDKTNNLILRYTYEFMPKGIISQFIVAIHELINEQQCVWKSGVVLSKDQTKAEVIEYYGKREIKIRVSGRHKRDFMTIVTHELDKIHDSYKRLKYNKLIPCNCVTCKDSQEPHFYSFEILRQFVADKQQGIQCQKSYQMVDVLGLIDDVMDRRELLKAEQQKSDDFLPNPSETRRENVVVTINNVIQPSKQENNFMTEPSKSEANSQPEVHKPSSQISPAERGIALAMALAVLIVFIVLVLYPRAMQGSTLAIIRFLAATFAGISGYLLTGSLGLEAHIPLSKTNIKATGAFAAFVLVLLLFFYGVPASENSDKPKPISDANTTITAIASIN
nr:COR domain-containing protein [Nostoc sp. DedQUE07]MDZ8130545.1 COR domain-containing protein [Nostoc sp. DedQUE07]